MDSSEKQRLIVSLASKMSEALVNIQGWEFISSEKKLPDTIQWAMEIATYTFRLIEQKEIQKDRKEFLEYMVGHTAAAVSNGINACPEGVPKDHPFIKGNLEKFVTGIVEEVYCTWNAAR